MPTSRLSLLFGLAAALVVAACGTPEMVVAPEPVPPPMTEAPAMPSGPVMGAPAPPMDGPMAASPFDTVRAGRFDNGRMFTLDEPPLAYFRETYNFTPDAAWFERARLGALRFATYCSASFVSDDGLIMTNHHCARQSVTQVSGEQGTDFNEAGFSALRQTDEAPVEGLFVEQLIGIEDVTAEVRAAETGADAQARAQGRQAAIEAIQARMGAAAGEGHRTQVVTLYAGGQYKAYTYRRYENIRLVFAPETQLGFFGGDPDNFTYPRYSLDFSLFRAYDENGRPLQTPNHFRFSPDGSDEGDLVFVIGNPGSTSRLQTVAELEYRRDVADAATLALLDSREDVYAEYVAANPDAEETPELLDTYFSLANSRKAYTGRVEGLRDEYLLARRRASEREFRARIEADPRLRTEYAGLFDQIGANRTAIRSNERAVRAFAGFAPGSPLTDVTMGRAFLAHQLTQAQAGGASAEDVAELRENILGLGDQPLAVQEGLLRLRLQDIQTSLGASDPLVQQLLAGQTPAARASAIIRGSALNTQAGTERLLAGSAIAADPAVQAAALLAPRVSELQGALGASGRELSEYSSRLARARFEVYGTEIPPDATFTLRISDGVVRGYEYNGTLAPPYTTFYGLYDRYHSFGPEVQNRAWSLPDRWLPAPRGLDLSTPYNFSSTNDIIGGNSGSPMLNRNLEVVGIAFDGNIESLPGNFIYEDTANRTVSLDSRAMVAVLEHVYGLGRLARELRNGGM